MWPPAAIEKPRVMTGEKVPNRIIHSNRREAATERRVNARKTKITSWHITPCSDREIEGGWHSDFTPQVPQLHNTKNMRKQYGNADTRKLMSLSQETRTLCAFSVMQGRDSL